VILSEHRYPDVASTDGRAAGKRRLLQDSACRVEDTERLFDDLTVLGARRKVRPNLDMMLSCEI